MTEQEWLECTDPQNMLEFLRRKASERKMRLFAVGCCRRVWGLIKDELFRAAVRAAELFADSMITKEEMTEIRNAAIPGFVQLVSGDEEASAAALSAAAIPAPKKPFFEQLLDAFDAPWWEDELDKGDPNGPALVTARHAAWAVAQAKGQRPLSGSHGELVEQREQAGLLRDIFGNPFHPVIIDSHWLTPNIVAFAQAIYDERRFEDMPILADALDDAGCTNADILNHCRSEGPHVRGCWVVDLILGKQ